LLQISWNGGLIPILNQSATFVSAVVGFLKSAAADLRRLDIIFDLETVLDKAF
jgi:hypothetical protein